MSPSTDILELQNLIFCDDARKEVSGKEILIGIYSGDIVLPKLPDTMGLVLWTTMVVREPGDHKVEFRIDLPGGGNSIEIEGFIQAAAKDGIAAMPTPKLPITLIDEGELVVSWRIDDQEWVELRRKPIKLAEGGTRLAPETQGEVSEDGQPAIA